MSALAACSGGPAAVTSAPTTVGAPPGWEVATVGPGESLAQLAARYGTDERTLLEANRLPSAAALLAGDRLLVPQMRSHTIQQGESVSVIAEQYGVRRADLITANEIAEPDYIRAGDRLVIPLSNADLDAARTWQPPTPQPTQLAAAPPAAPDPFQPVDTVAPVNAVEAAALTAPPPPAAGIEATGTGTAGIDDELIGHHRNAALDPVPQVPAVEETTLGRAESMEPAPVTRPDPAPVRPSVPPPAPRTAAAPQAAAEPERFQWPLSGDLVPTFEAGERDAFRDGLNIAAPAGTPILAAREGTVVYAGNELRGYGNLVIVRHDDGWVTAYAHAQALSVSRGDVVRAGEQIGAVGQTGAVTSPQLHFEIRRGSEPVNPLDHLPRSG